MADSVQWLSQSDYSICISILLILDSSSLMIDWVEYTVVRPLLQQDYA